MKKKSEMENNELDVNRIRFTEIPPASYRFKIESFSLLLETKLEKYETNEFVAGCHKWRLVLYPNGKCKGDTNNHISLFLAIAEPKDNSLSWGVRVNAKFFVFDQTRHRYSIIHDNDGEDWRFDNMETEWGLTNFLSHDALNDASNGYLIDDCCILGVEVLVVENSRQGETLSLVKEPTNGLYIWTIDNYSAMNMDDHYSQVFTVGGTKWKLKLCPKGAGNRHTSLYLLLDSSEILPPKRKLYANYILRIRNQANGKNHEWRGKNWFDAPGVGWGLREFMSLSDLKNTSKGYLLHDRVIIEVKFDVISAVKDFS